MRTHRQSIIFLLAVLLTGSAGAQSEPGRIGIDAFIRMHAMKAVLVIDVRGTDAYRAGHIPGALHVPLDQIAARADEIRSLVKAPHPIVTYCSCPEEHASLAAVRLLAEHGISNASALVGGFPAWVAKGGIAEKK
jgi:rhodanese-related sulfurtransferase